MLLQHKNAVIYGAGGSLGRAVAEALAQAGARVFVTGHRLASVQQTADSGSTELPRISFIKKAALPAAFRISQS